MDIAAGSATALEAAERRPRGRDDLAERLGEVSEGN